ncbi:DUF7093 family protein [Halocalculus aciditolerans]|uniref:Uncharacterized protein n=1 Tax=Halocalculus aciditolerans TaxID=1383812 RepID=A0A830FFI9_9EURY|nr:hypothetical protein [Halocalculus aciditolerans]GGL69841.1 hypothetical protein GCM10009039_29810 [Halocalculus aciditolerans]
MGLTCSLLGHDYGEPEVVRNREEQGNEVVETVREVKTCTRCGNEQIVSENTEVRSIRQPEEVGIDEDTTRPGDATSDAGDDDAAADTAQSTSADEAAEAEPSIEDQRIEAETDWPDPDDDGGGSGRSASSGGTPEPSTSASEGSAGGEFEPAQSAEEDDGIILEDTGEEEAGKEQWSEPAGADGENVGELTGEEPTPDGEDVEVMTDTTTTTESTPTDSTRSQETGGSASASTSGSRSTSGTAASSTSSGGDGGWPEAAGVDEGYDATNPADDTDDGESGVSFGGSLTPSRTEETASAAAADEDAELLGSDESDTSAAQPATAAERVDGDAANAEGDAASAGSRADPGAKPEEVLVCGECGHEASPERLSLRAGDICPDCHRGYLESRNVPR